MLPRYPSGGPVAAVTGPGREVVGGRRLLHGRYELGEVLGRGGMAEVRLCIDHRLGRTVAVKTLRSELASDPTFQERFRREARSAAGLNHPSIVAVYDTGDEIVNGVPVPYIAMEYVEGSTLREVLGDGDRPQPVQALEATAAICEALEYAHRAGIVHRDIKPANVMLTPTGQIKVMDFGIARAVNDAGMTQTAAVIGTAQYLSPEQASGEPVDARSDIYSTGCVLYELLAGRPPFVGDSPVSVAYQHVQEEPQPPTSLDPSLPPVVDAITLMALQKEPFDRYQSAAELRDDIERCLSGQPVAAAAPPSEVMDRFIDTTRPGPPPVEEIAPPPARTRPAPNQARSRRSGGCALVVLALLFLLGVAAFIAFRVLALSEKGPTSLSPSLVHKTEHEAEVILAREDLELGEVEMVASGSVPKGQVIAQDPNPGRPVKVGDTVNLTVSGGKATRTVPNLVGIKLPEAKAQLASKGFEAKQDQDNKSNKPRGTVTSSVPPPGAPAPEGATITLFYATGLEEVPAVVLTSEDAAKSSLEDAGFDVHTVNEEAIDVLPGTVLDQDPVAGAMRRRGSTITITVATQPEPEPSPTTPDPTTPTPSQSPTDDQPPDDDWGW
jgi:eukaryotic-like serine/threonine-protein kinase